MKEDISRESRQSNNNLFIIHSSISFWFLIIIPDHILLFPHINYIVREDNNSLKKESSEKNSLIIIVTKPQMTSREPFIWNFNYVYLSLSPSLFISLELTFQNPFLITSSWFSLSWTNFPFPDPPDERIIERRRHNEIIPLHLFSRNKQL